MKSSSLLFVTILGVFGAVYDVAQAQDAAPAATPVSPPVPAVDAAAVDAAPTRASRRKIPPIGVNVSAFFPTSSKTRRAFGSTWTSFGLGLGSTLVPKARVYPDFNILSQEEGDDRIFALTAGARYLRPLGKDIDRDHPPTFAPYVGLGLNLIYADADAPSQNTDDKGVGVGASATLGTTLGRTFFVEGRYSLFTRTADFNLSGTQLVVGARF